MLHGTFGEDGTIQGLFELAASPMSAPGVLGSSAGMDKDVMKRLFAQARLPIVKHVTLLRAEWEKSPRKAVAQVEAALKYPVFVKPANLGSSVGISKAHDRKELGPALTWPPNTTASWSWSRAWAARRPRRASSRSRCWATTTPRPAWWARSFPARSSTTTRPSISREGSVPVIPAKLTKAETKQIREMAVAAFRACDLSGLARVDFLMEPDGKRRIFLNEVNTMPGFTRISMYPKLWEATGLSYKDLITRLIELALERQAEKSRTMYSREG